MKSRNLYLIIALAILPLANRAQKYTQIITNEQIAIDTFFNKWAIQDKYRWLETQDKGTEEWVEQQNAQSNKYLNKAISNTKAYDIIDKYTYVKYANPQKQGNYYFMVATYNEGVPALFYQTDINAEPNLLVDPNYISNKDKIILKEYAVSKDSKLLAYQFSRNGSDWGEVKVVSILTGIHKKDHLTGLKFSNIAWLGDGFFYTTFSQTGQFGVTLNQKICYHKIGNDQNIDSTIYKLAKPESIVSFDYLTTSDERFFVLEELDKQNQKINYYYIDYRSEKPVLSPLIIDSPLKLDILDSRNGKLIAKTSTNSNFGKIVEIDPKQPSAIRTIVAERKDTLLLKAIPFIDRLVSIYQINQRPLAMVTNYSGQVLHTLRFPVGSTANGFLGQPTDEEVLFDFTTYTTPPLVYKFNLRNYKKELLKKTSVNFSIDNIEYKEIAYLSKDSVSIPMVLVYQKGLKLNGNNPTILNAYGGFGIVETPAFDPGIVYFIKQGGIYAFANIRGGGEKGKEWAHQGRGENKQKSFDDFIYAAEYLIKNNYTNCRKLAATGASNGGLVVAATAIQRPDLFKTLVPVVAPLDMTRFDKFTVGRWWSSEYGTVKDSVSFLRLLSYSPYHNIQDTVNYPSMLIVTSENDDRVPPFHSYKFAAKLQSRLAQKNPVLLKIEKQAGHNGAETFLTNLKARSEIFGFIMNELTKE